MIQEKKLILIVEDEAPLRESLKTALQKNNFDIITATTGKEGLESIMRLRPDLILLDIMMPEMDGIAMAEALVKLPNYKGIPIIALSNINDIELFKSAIQHGVNDYLVKSDWDLDELVAKIINKLQVPSLQF